MLMVLWWTVLAGLREQTTGQGVERSCAVIDTTCADLYGRSLVHRQEACLPLV